MTVIKYQIFLIRQKGYRSQCINIEEKDRLYFLLLIIIMSILNQGNSSSLVIAEGKNDFQINSSEQKPKREDDLFNLSNDQPSLSFQIEQQKRIMVVRQLARQSQQDTLVLNVIDPPQQQNKRKRKQIFDRGRRTERSIVSKIQANNGGDNLLSIFDQIFKTKGQDSTPFCGEVNCRDSRLDDRPMLQGITVNRSRTPSAERRQRVRIFGKRKDVKTFEGILPPDILQDSPPKVNQIQKPMTQNFDIGQSPVKQRRSDDSINFFNISKRFSAINNDFEDHQYSRDSMEINNILQSQLFKDQVTIKPKEQIRIQQRIQPRVQQQKEQRIQTRVQQKIQPMTQKNAQPRIQPQIYSKIQQRINPIIEQKFESRIQQKIQPQIRSVQRQQRRIASYQQKNMPVTNEQKNESVNFVRKIGPKFVQNQQIQLQTKYFPPQDFQQQKIKNGPPIKIDNIAFPQQIEESRYIINDISSTSSVNSVYVHKYNSLNNVFAPENSTVNVKKPIFGDVSSLKLIQFDKRQYNGLNLLAESQVIQRQQPLDIHHIFEQQSRLPIFLRKLRKRISIYPNFNILVSSPNTSEAITEDFNELFDLFQKCSQFLASMCQKALQAKSKMQLYMQQLMSNLSLDFFLESGWQKMNFEDYELIKPVQPIEIRGWSYEKAKTALTNYQSIINYYQSKGIKLDVSSDKGKKKYFQIRQKFWDICGNMKLISEDIFLEMRGCMFPQHYYEFLVYMRSEFPGRMDDKRLKYVRKLLNLYRFQCQQNDPLVRSEIGVKIKQKMQLQLRYLAPY